MLTFLTMEILYYETTVSFLILLLTQIILF